MLKVWYVSSVITLSSKGLKFSLLTLLTQEARQTHLRVNLYGLCCSYLLLQTIEIFQPLNSCETYKNDKVRYIAASLLDKHQWSLACRWKYRNKYGIFRWKGVGLSRGKRGVYHDWRRWHRQSLLVGSVAVAVFKCICHCNNSNFILSVQSEYILHDL